MIIPTSNEKLPDGLRFVEARDQRPDDAILQSLTEYQPVRSEKNVWAFWHAGVKSMPGWCQRNVINWIRLQGPDWTVRVLDNQSDSPNKISAYIPPEMLPEACQKGAMTGPYVGQHSADLLRSACLYLHGGVWMDVGILLLRRLERICWTQLEDPASPFEVCIPHLAASGIANFFVASRKGSPFIKHWHELFVHLWQGRSSCAGVGAHPLITPIVEASPFWNGTGETEGKYSFPFAVEKESLMDYVGQMLAWSRVCMVEDAGDGFNGSAYWRTKVLLFDALNEGWAAEPPTGWSGVKLLDALSTPLSATEPSEKYKLGAQVVWRLLEGSSMQKVFHGKDMMSAPSLGTLWDQPENEGRDQAPGTFAELLRFGSVHYEQEREMVYKEAPEPELRLQKGLYKP